MKAVGAGEGCSTPIAMATDLSDAYYQGDEGFFTIPLSVHCDAARQISRLKPVSQTLLCRQHR